MAMVVVVVDGSGGPGGEALAATTGQPAIQNTKSNPRTTELSIELSS